MLTDCFEDTIYNLTRRFWFQAHQVEPQECGLGQKFHLYSSHFLEKFNPYNVHGLTKSQFSLWFIEYTLHFVMKHKTFHLNIHLEGIFGYHNNQSRNIKLIPTIINIGSITYLFWFQISGDEQKINAQILIFDHLVHKMI